jgi:hypothetical protein
MPAHCGRRLRGPGAFDQHTSGRGVPGLGHGTLLASLARGGCRGNQPQEFPQCSWGLKTRPGTHCGHHGAGHGAWHTTQGLQGVDHRTQAPGCDLLWQCLVKTPKTCGVCVHRTDIVLENAVRSGRWTHDFGEPSEGSRAPVGPASVADVLAEQAGCETELGVLESAEGIFPHPREVTDSFICDPGARDWREST